MKGKQQQQKPLGNKSMIPKFFNSIETLKCKIEEIY